MTAHFQIISLLALLIFGLGALILGLRIVVKCKGRLRVSLTLFSVSLAVLIIHEIVNALNVTGSFIGTTTFVGMELPIVNLIGHIIISLFAFLALLNFDKLVSEIGRKK